MSLPITFDVDGDPRGAPRPRAFRIKTKDGKAFNRIVSTPTGAPMKTWREILYLTAKGWAPPAPLQGALRVSLRFRMRRPKNHMRSGKHAGEVRGSAPHWHTGRPDLDNLEKGVLDVLTQLAYWQDDSQVAELESTKVYATRPGAVVVISALEEQS